MLVKIFCITDTFAVIETLKLKFEILWDINYNAVTSPYLNVLLYDNNL